MLDWTDTRERLSTECLLEWDWEHEPQGRTLRLSLRSISGRLAEPLHSPVCFAVLVIDDVTGFKTVCEAERQLHVLSCQLIDAQETERKKIAAELHDGIGQMMGAIKFQVESLMANRLPGRRPPTDEQLGSIVENVRCAMNEVRKIAMDLRPSTLDDLGLLLTIDWFCREFCTMYAGIRIQKQLAAEESAITEERKIVIYRVMQEAMTNIAKYAHATVARLELKDRDDGLYFRIQDDGQGFDVAALPRASCFHGFGLRSMRERVELTGGVFVIESKPGGGTTVQVHWPKQPAAEGSLGN
jgi:signal transduction histidine kinase